MRQKASRLFKKLEVHVEEEGIRRRKIVSFLDN